MTPELEKEHLLKHIFAGMEAVCAERGTSLSTEMARLLGISPSSAYKKMRGSVGLSAEELILLSQGFGLQLDKYIHDNEVNVHFVMTALRPQARTPLVFLSELKGMLQRFGGPGSNLRVTYATNEVPIFYYFLFPELTAFKLTMWHRTVWSLHQEQAAVLSVEDLLESSDIQDLRLSLLHEYLHIPSEEYYPINIFDNTLHQISFARVTGDISEELAQKLFDQMMKLSKWMKECAAVGQKSLPDAAGNTIGGAEYTLYFNEITFTNNIILTESNKAEVVFSTMDNPNFIHTLDKRVVGQLRRWFQAMSFKSHLISNVGEKARRDFFNKTINRIEAVKAGQG